MRSTSPPHPGALADARVHPRSRNRARGACGRPATAANGNQYFAIPSLPHGAFGSMGGMQVSARDLGRYVAFHLSAWPPRDDPESGPVRRSSVREMQHPWRSVGVSINAPDRPRSARTSAYGYGLSVSQTCRFRRIVAHSGGLPGFGSNMMWLPDYGVGIFVMTNLTYTSGAAAVEQALRDPAEDRRAAASRTASVRRLAGYARGHPPGLERPGPAGSGKAGRGQPLSGLLRQPPDPANRAAAGRSGRCREPGPVKPDNLLRGGFRIPCEKGVVNVYFTLAPTMPPKVQRLDFRFVPNLSPAAQKSVGAHSDLATRQLPIRRTALPDRFRTADQLDATVRLECDHGPLLARVDLESDGKLTHVSLVKPDDQADECARRDGLPWSRRFNLSAANAFVRPKGRILESRESGSQWRRADVRRAFDKAVGNLASPCIASYLAGPRECWSNLN